MNNKGPTDAAYIRRLWNHQLEPIKVMLVHRRKDLTTDDWLKLVEVTRKSILTHPDQYLVDHFESEDLLKQLINKIFDDFTNYVEN